MAIRATQPATPAAVASATGGGNGDELGAAATVPPEANEDARIPPGTMVADRYKIARVLGEGGMGVVYAAEHVLMRKEVALKVLHAEMCSMPEVVARFEREAIAAAHIDHPNVAGATDFGRLPDGACYLVLELLRGTSLRDEIARGPIPRERALRILHGIAAGVAAAHAKGIVHRDLKPENVMLVDRNGDADFVKVLDFGIAKVDTTVAAAPQAGTSKVLTRVGSVFGTPEYMAPEQAVGDAVDARADLYAIGVIFLEMLTGKCPFQGNALSILRERILAVGPPDMSAVADPGARALIARLLTRQPDERMQTAAELVSATGALIDEGNDPSLPATPAPAASVPMPVSSASSQVFESTTPRTRWFLPIAIAAVIGIGAGAFAVVSSTGNAKQAGVKAPRTAAADSVASPTAPSEKASPAQDSTSASPEPTAPSSNPAVPAASAASARATPRKAAPKTTRPQQAPKKGSGGINIPPPKDWFK